jgi:hypothetical protein
MNRQDQQHLLAEQKFLREHLDRLPPSARLTRMGVESRLRGVAERLTVEALDEREPARVRLTFNGRPVIGSYGIFAEFGMKAVSSFSDAVSTVAASLSTALAPMGPVPNREQYQLIITGSALGSFGFELEEYRAGQLPLEDVSPVAQAIERTQNLLKSTLGTDEELADSASDTDPRALDKVRSFLQTLAENEAIFTMQYQKSSVRFTDVGQVKSSLARLSQENFHEEENFLEGEFQGVLPKGRTFEFSVGSDKDDIVRGKVGPSIQDADTLNNHLHKATRIKVMVTRVGSGRPRYVLLETPEWQA